MAEVPFPATLAILFDPHPYKIIKGGRGGGRSWGCARALLLEGMQRPERILCARQVQTSIKDSVHQLLVDQIGLLGLTEFYRWTETAIRGVNGTTFLFSGLQDQTATSLKSFEGITKCWVEEAQSVTKRAWNLLIPTVRAAGREFWITFNPGLESDETYQRFVVHPPPGAVVVTLNWRDNPWFPAVLEAERQHAKATMDEEEYLNIWEGEPTRSVPGAIYARELAKLYAENRVTLCPYDPKLKVHVAQDMGFTNITAVGFFQRRHAELRCIKTIGYQGLQTPEIAGLLRAMPYNYGAVWLPHDAFHTGRHGDADDVTYRKFGFSVKRVPDVPVETGIRHLRTTLSQMWFHAPDTQAGLDGLKHFKRHHSVTGTVGGPLRDDEGSRDWGDMFRYASLSANLFYNETTSDRMPHIRPRLQTDPYSGALGV